ncbi:MAG: hypothetical protein M3440_01530 [Chloroflexota bacterium]|nr:hypothetical protein [Chloroflexota bacterium]
MQSESDQHRASRFGSAAFSGLVMALVAVVLLKAMFGLTVVPALVVACLAFILTGAITLWRSTR